MSKTDELKPQDVKLSRTSKGKKPIYFDEVSDRLLSMNLALAQELSVLRDRIETIECIAEEKGLLLKDEIDTYEMDPEQRDARAKRREEFLQRYMRSVIADIERLQMD